MTRPMPVKTPTYKISTLKFPKANRVLDSILQSYILADYGTEAMRDALEKPRLKVSAYPADNVSFTIVCDRYSCDALGAFAGWLERSDGDPERVRELRLVASNFKRYLKSLREAPPAPAPAPAPAVDLTQNFYDLPCTCPSATCKREALRRAQETVVVKDEAKAWTDESAAVSHALPPPTHPRIEPEPADLIVLTVPIHGRLEIQNCTQQEQATSELTALLRFSDAYRQQYDKDARTAKSLAYEIGHSVNRLALLGAIRGKNGVQHVPEYSTARIA
jgi:hypothetical protein